LWFFNIFVKYRYINLNYYKTIIIYQGFYNNLNYNQIFLYLPVSIYIEKISFFYNLEGRLRKTLKVLTSSFYVFSDFEIMRSLFYFKNFFFKANFSILNFFYFITFFFSSFIDYSCLYFFSLYSFVYLYSFNTFSFFSEVFRFFFCKKFIVCNSLYNVKGKFWNIFIRNSSTLMIEHTYLRMLCFIINIFKNIYYIY
jgi:hypothetical protein